MATETTGVYDIAISQGETLSRTFIWKDANDNPFDLTSYTASAQVRDEKDNLLVDLNTTNGGIVLGGTAGTITLTIEDEVMATLPAGDHVWDLFLFSPAGTSRRLIKGMFIVDERVTE